MTHAHHWRIDEPDGRQYLDGRCDCGATRLFPATTDVVEFNNRGISDDGRARHRRHTMPQVSLIERRAFYVD